MRRCWQAGVTALAGALFWAAPAWAGSAGDAAAGKIKFYTCAGCHGIPSYSNAYPAFDVPKLGGQHAAYIVAALKDYRSGKRKSAIMHAQASSLSDADIRDIAAFLAQQKGQ